MKRYKITVRRHKSGGWMVGPQMFWCARKKDAIKAARSIGRYSWSKGQLAQVVCYRSNGTIEWEATYGLDPRRHRG